MGLFQKALLLAMPVGILLACDANVLVGPIFEELAKKSARDYALDGRAPPLAGVLPVILCGSALIGVFLCAFFASRAPSLVGMYRRSGYSLVAAGTSLPLFVLVSTVFYESDFSLWQRLIYSGFFGLCGVAGGIYLLYFRGETRQSLPHQLFTYIVAGLFSLPVAFFLAADVALAFGEKDLPYDDQLVRISFFLSWVVMAYVASRTGTPSGVFRRNASGFSMAAFLLPVAGLIFLLTEEPASDPIFPSGLIFGVTLAFGCSVGALFWFLSRAEFGHRQEPSVDPVAAPPSSKGTRSHDGP